MALIKHFRDSDVTVFFLKVLPTLAEGVLVGIHDIYLPDDYPAWAASSFPNEQYLLAAAILGGGCQKVVLPVWFVHSQQAAQKSLSQFWTRIPGIQTHGGIFWFDVNADHTREGQHRCDDTSSPALIIAVRSPDGVVDAAWCYWSPAPVVNQSPEGITALAITANGVSECVEVGGFEGTASATIRQTMACIGVLTLVAPSPDGLRIIANGSRSLRERGSCSFLDYPTFGSREA